MRANFLIETCLKTGSNLIRTAVYRWVLVGFVMLPFGYLYWQSDWVRFLILIMVSVVFQALLGTRLKQHQHLREKELEAQNARYKSQFLANINHEIRTPMNAILGLSRMFDASGLNDKQREFLEIIQNASEDLHRIVNDMLDYSKIESGQFSFQYKPFKINTLLLDLEKRFAFMAEEKGLSFEVQRLPYTALVLLGDPVRLSQILGNLISNAIKFTEKGRVRLLIHATAGSDDSMLFEFSVDDSGIGIPSEKLELVFESFSQLNEVSTPARGGAGLGLTIAKQLVEQQGGQIYIQSAVNQGTAVSFSLRFKIPEQPKSGVSPIVPTQANQLNNLRILLVEDAVINQMLALELLRSQIDQVSVDIAENGQQALDMLENQSFDLVLMDVKMPVMDGLEATRRIRAHRNARIRNTPVIGLTAYAVPFELEKCRLAGMDSWVTKPIDSELLVQVMAAVKQ